MAIPKKKSRKITVSDTQFRYICDADSLGPKDWETPISIAVELLDSPTSVAHFMIDGVVVYNLHGGTSRMSITPKLTHELIEMALEKGWDPHSKKDFLYRFKCEYDENNVFRLVAIEK
jgi:hypothetical protein